MARPRRKNSAKRLPLGSSRALARVLRELASNPSSPSPFLLPSPESPSTSSDTDPGDSFERAFSKEVKRACWEKADVPPGRDPARWRVDVAGNILFRPLVACEGAFCYTFDHVIPFTQGGESTLNNCQILQTSVNQAKGNRVGLTTEELRHMSLPSNLGEREMDALEVGLYGNVSCRDGCVHFGVKPRGVEGRQRRPHQEGCAIS